MSHTPKKIILYGASGCMITTPDGYVGEGFIAAVDTKANAQFIVKAWNNHYQLLEALKLGLSKRHPTKESSALLISLGWDGGATICANDFVNKLIHAAIAKAEGE